MELAKWKKDENKYIVFRCSKCKQYIYAKTTQKSKKCLRCGRAYQIKKINSGEVVKGMTAAVNMVKKMQNKLAIKELGGEPDLRSLNDFSIASGSKTVPLNRDINISKILVSENYDYAEEFKEALLELSARYKAIPDYLIKIMAEEKMIPGNELKILISKFQKKGILIPLKSNYYRINKEVLI